VLVFPLVGEAVARVTAISHGQRLPDIGLCQGKVTPLLARIAHGQPHETVAVDDNGRIRPHLTTLTWFLRWSDLLAAPAWPPSGPSDQPLNQPDHD
jgi:hypothetical protein